MLRRLLVISIALLVPAALPAGAGAATTTPQPTVRTVKPAKAGIGDVLTITGRHFRSGKGKTTVIFRRDGAKPLFVRSASGTSTKLTVLIPDGLLKFLPLKDGKPAAARFRIRILAGRLGARFTSLKVSPRIGPSAVVAPPTPPAPTSAPTSDCDKDGIPNADELDDDNDLLPDTLEAKLGTDPCKADTDGDGLEDGWEYESALDLNVRAVPYPGKRPYPNPLDGSDANADNDGDQLSAAEEYAMWIRYGGHKLPLNYSDGTQTSGAPGPDPLDPTQVLSLNGRLTDDEKDVDGDGLTNWDELHGRMVQGWWTRIYDQEKAYPLVYLQVDYLDPDTDGDGVLDGADDQDHDDWTNSQEVNRTLLITGFGRWVQPFNPCLPDYESRTCSLHPPKPADSWPPYDDKTPGGYPTVSGLPLPPLRWPLTSWPTAPDVGP